KGIYTLEQCLEKDWLYMQGLVSEPVDIRYPSKRGMKKITLLPAERVVISPSVFRRYSCMDYAGCTNCCYVRAHNVFLEGYTPGDVLQRIPPELLTKVKV